MKRALCIPLDEVTDQQVGGKAEGLVRLIRNGLEVPPGFVIAGASAESIPPDLETHYARIGGGRVAVRSSGIGEDSADASFAGQYETVLDVEGIDALEKAVVRCFESADNARATAYREERAGDVATTMCVVVQAMVDAQAAGVLFTVDPVTARRDRLVIDAVPGLGESLVSGEATPDHWLVDRTGLTIHRDLQGHEPVLGDATLERLVEGALRAEAAQGVALDMEWAVDQAGAIHWLQARPVTSLPGDPNELDTEPPDQAVYTWANIGEMMPGAVTPLTFSVTGRGIDTGMQRMYRQIGSHVPEDDGLRYVAMFFGHLFLDLRSLAMLAADVAGSTKKQMCLALCGRDVAELPEPEPASAWKRGLNGARYFRMLTAVRRHGRALDALKDELRLPNAKDARGYYRAVDESLPAVWRAYELHLMSSSAAGALSPILLGIVAKGGEPTSDHHAEVAQMLAGATGVESADIAEGAERIVEALLVHPDAQEAFATANPESALSWIRSPAAGLAGSEFARYLDRHGHRAVRELELRQPGWAEDPSPVVASLQSGLRARAATGGPSRPKRRTASEDGTRHPFLNRLLPLAHEAVRCREHTKSALVAVTAHFKRAYRALGQKMVTEGLLPDEDAVFFGTHEELGRLISGEAELATTMLRRRQTIDLQMPLRFDEVFTGSPEPIAASNLADSEGSLTGRPVSRGVVRGKARVVRTLAEAAALEAGEILIAPITDVGWTPYFNLIAGLATDVGSAVSHGAVVAREFGLPAVVNLRAATTQFRTGDVVVLDGNEGTLSLDDQSMP
ncbi:MAG: PEP/pyruvate-binding domain-containing protein [Myxococcota bacterium]